MKIPVWLPKEILIFWDTILPRWNWGTVQWSNLSNIIQSQYTCNLDIYPGNMALQPMFFIHTCAFTHTFELLKDLQCVLFIWPTVDAQEMVNKYNWAWFSINNFVTSLWSQPNILSEQGNIILAFLKSLLFEMLVFYYSSVSLWRHFKFKKLYNTGRATPSPLGYTHVAQTVMSNKKFLYPPQKL